MPDYAHELAFGSFVTPQVGGRRRWARSRE